MKQKQITVMNNNEMMEGKKMNGLISRVKRKLASRNTFS